MHMDKKLMHRLFLLVAGCLVFAWLLLDTPRATAMLTELWDLLSPFFTGAVIAFIFNVPMRAIENQLIDIRKPGLRRTLAIVLTIASLILVIMFVVELLVPQVTLTVDSLSAKIPSFLERTGSMLTSWLDQNPMLKDWILDFTNMESDDWTTLAKNALTFVSDKATDFMGSAVTVIGSVTSGIVDGVIGIFFAMYCLGRKEILARQGRRLLYSLVPEHVSDEIVRILRLANVTFSNFISGQCLEACILGCLFAVAMSLFGMPYVPLVSVTIAVTALVPVVGAFIGCVVGAFFILVDNPLQAVTFVAMFLILQQIENNLIYPRVVGTSIGLPGMWVLVAVTVGGGLMGVGGMLLMIPLTSVCYTLLREFTDKRLAKLGIPEDKLLDHPPDILSPLQQRRERRERHRLQKMRQKLQALQKNQKDS